ncbi:aspartate carbamoyltransferase [Maricaulis maris MCS10]|uniref:Aspartate carbamoyltransferase catalytic subunit n=1 Tax=Maricaulis maris (strain MCS10) TaxID=394221 RepID=PYRB_MARMM|nr:aspartate carbamoyltransferase catalytic subunit [Maricaulis maris]Q0ANY2.1 RecName: Full=Aspartate carbamoyltransferase catalytic subunit; AltName: Full=Aspartate transcarbamylase; Short=ATCase [Maricaulis maris MCS10]ABI66005.1 aspartate carbamoyltransferase [Maricaulis maris MCS10]
MSRAEFSYDFPHRHLLSVADLNPVDIQIIFERAAHHLATNRTPDKRSDVLRGLTVLNLFFEASTRTQGSFEMAGKRLGADVVNFAVAHSSASKGESLSDTARTLAAMKPDIMVVRHSATGAPQFLADHTGLAVVNAGDGMHEHPTQALLDSFTLSQHWGSVGGRRILIVGDILHSRVARSNIGLLNILGAEIRLCAPPTLLPSDVDQWGCDVFHDLDEALKGCDAVMALRQQRERMSGGFVPSEREFFHLFGLTHERLEVASPDVLVMHPGPMNRGVEIHTKLADDPERSVILEQVESGVAVRMAILELIGANIRKEASA